MIMHYTAVSVVNLVSGSVDRTHTGCSRTRCYMNTWIYEKRRKMTGRWGKSQNEEFLKLYSSQNKGV